MTKITRLFHATVLLLAVVTFSACKKTFDAPPGPSDLPIVANTTIATLKSLHTVAGQMDAITDDIIISGIVTANDKTGNLYKELYIEDSTGAVKLLLNSTGLYNSYPVGRRVYVFAKNLYLSDDNFVPIIGMRSVVAGTPQMVGILTNEIPNYLKGGSINNTVTPTVVTLDELGTPALNNSYIGKLVKLEGFEFTPNDTLKTYSDTSVYRSDRNDTLWNCDRVKTIIRTSAYANFAAVRVPSGNGDFTAIYAPYRTTKQFILRDTSDVNFTNPRCGSLPPGAVTLLSEDFESYTVATVAPYTTTAIPGWQNAAQANTFLWTTRIFGGNKYAYMSAFATTPVTTTTWLVTKGINLNATTGEILKFKTMQGFITSGGVPVKSDLKILISTNYTGTGSPWATGVTWTDVTSLATLSPGSTTSSFPSSFTASGNIDMSTYSGTAYVAFRYEGGVNKTSAWEVDDILVYGF